MKKNIWLVGIVIGIVNAVLLYVFEFIGIDVTNWLWNDVFQTDTYRWLVIPVAWLLGLGLTAVILALRNKRLVPPEADLMADMNDPPHTLQAIGTILAIGGMSLLAGAALGPEQALMMASAAIGSYAAVTWGLTPAKQLLVLSSIGALLVAFFSSVVIILIPLLIMFKTAKDKGQKLQPKPMFIVVLAGVVSYGTIKTINYVFDGSATTPAVALPHFKPIDLIAALVLGLISGFLALCLNQLIEWFYKLAKWIDGHKLPAHEWVVGLILSTVLGVLYLIGGRTVEFSGSVGSNLLEQNAAQYGAAALAGLIIVKLLTTSWSKGAGYRGGLVFPSIYIGLALGLLTGHLVSGLAGSGAIIGSISGMVAAAVGSPIIAGIFLIAILPWKLIPVAFAAVIGTMIFTKLQQRFSPKKTT